MDGPLHEAIVKLNFMRPSSQMAGTNVFCKLRATETQCNEALDYFDHT